MIRLHSHQRPRAQGGVVLIMALILLTVASLVAVYTLRGALTGEQVSKNLRTNAVAMQAAETALRLCEDVVRTGAPTITVGAAVVNVIQNSLPLGANVNLLPSQWSTRANWAANAGKAIVIPAALLTFAGQRPVPSPRCMIERYELPIVSDDRTLSPPFLITAVGYSPDYQADNAGNAIAGAEVFLQSVLVP